MDALGLPVPTSLFSTQQQALMTIGEIVAAIKAFGSRVTIAELIGAGAVSEWLAAAGAFYASWYVGGAIGSLIVASRHSLVCPSGASVSKVAFDVMAKKGIWLDADLRSHISSHAEVANGSRARRNYGILATKVAAA
ncbi:hypothetical protein FAZ95_08445 [Trinickia violacea]|uniref:Uncharacterized protein n=1 Tax=Trinickia violacea TaxID=2571746 RepID=A0A4P8IQM2_9BURK|nr:hypothetical protein [Trinickia violacea]QCP49204.1 hypothetical protein FAZ95_08445 [Trinickia violacea]